MLAFSAGSLQPERKCVLGHHFTNYGKHTTMQNLVACNFPKGAIM